MTDAPTPSPPLSDELRIARINRFANCIVFIEAAVADDAKLAFLAITDELLSTLRAKDARIAGLEAALKFYTNPFGCKDEAGEQVRVPDFYDELCFGDRARSALDGKDKPR